MSSAGDKLAQTRLAIVDHLQRRDRRRGGAEARQRTERESVAAGEDGDPDERIWERPEQGSGAAGWFGSIKHAAGAWWRHHPAHMGLELATPILSSYAGRKPALFLGVAAVLGAVVVVARPWRLISVTGLLLAVVKSSQLSSVVLSAMSAADFQKDHQPRR